MWYVFRSLRKQLTVLSPFHTQDRKRTGQYDNVQKHEAVITQ